MSVHDDIFPAERDRDYVQTEWSRGWGYAVIGFGEAARILTEQRTTMHASVDQIGLAVFYLQRHRVELVLKQAMFDYLRVDLSEGLRLRHNLEALWQRFGESVAAIDLGAWQVLHDDHGEFVAVMHAADRGSLTYRYPVDTQGTEARRADFINLEELQRYTERFENGVHGFIDWWTEMGREEAEEYGLVEADYEGDWVGE